MSAPTIEEERLLIQFRDRVEHVLETEEQKQTSFLIRWLRARNYDLDQSEKMLKTSLEWRKVNGADYILKNPVDAYCERECPYYIHGHDKYGHPIIVFPTGKWNFRKYVSDRTPEEITHFAIHSFENVCRAIKNANTDRNPDLYPITQFTLLVDWTGFSYWHMCSLKAIQRMLYDSALFEAHYPEIGFRCLMINSPAFVTIFMKMMRPIYPPKTYEKISVHGNDRKAWEQACREIIDDDQFQQILKFIG